MRNIYTLLFVLFGANVLHAQVYDGPESVEVDPADGSVFVSNANVGNIIKLLPNGTLQSFATGFTYGPHGLELIGDTLYVCDGAYIRLVNRTTGAIINSVNLSATFLNGITHVGKNIFATDFTAKKIYRMNTVNNSFNMFASTLTKTPNGIIYDYLNNRLVYCCWGSSAPVYEVSLSDSSINFLASTATSNCDGIAMNCQGQFYIASWSPNAINKYNSTFSTVSAVTVSGGVSSPADIYFDSSTDTLIIPNSGANSVSKVHLSSCLSAVNELSNSNLNLAYPNPFNTNLTIEGKSNIEAINVANVLGESVFSFKANSNKVNLDLQALPNGTYFVRINYNNSIQTIKVSKE